MADPRTRTDLWSTILGLLRRRAVVVPAVLVAVALAAAAFVATPKTYAATSTMVLMTTEYGATTSTDPLDPAELSNPLLNFNDSLRTTSAMLIQSMNTKDVATALDARGPTRLTVDDGRSNPELLGLNGPFVFVKGESTTPEAATEVVRGATAMMRELLLDWQATMSAPEKTYVGLVDVVAPTAPERDYGQSVQYAVMAGVLGFLVCLAFAFGGQRLRGGRGGPAQDEVEALEDEGPADVRILRSR